MLSFDLYSASSRDSFSFFFSVLKSEVDSRAGGESRFGHFIHSPLFLFFLWKVLDVSFYQVVKNFYSLPEPSDVGCSVEKTCWEYRIEKSRLIVNDRE